MKTVKIAELWLGVEEALKGDKSAGVKFAIIEAHKILENTLKSKGYPGKAIEKKLYWAGYSLQDEGGIKLAINKRNEILENFNYELSDIEAEDILVLYKKIVQEIVSRDGLSFKKRINIFLKVNLYPNSIYFWRNLVVFFSFFIVVRILGQTNIGNALSELLLSLSLFFISWISVIMIIVFLIIFLIVTSYKSSHTGIKIKGE